MQKALHETVRGPAVAADTVVFGIDDNKLKILLIQIKDGPYADKWALPGGLVCLGESPEATAIRVLKSKANIKTGYLEQLYTFGNPNRDTRGQVVSVAHMLLAKDISLYDLVADEHYLDIKWISVADLPNMAFDHMLIIDFALTRLRGKLTYSNIATSFLPDDFSMEALKNVYEIIQDKKYNQNEFNHKIDKMDLLEPSGNNLYHFKYESVSYFEQ